MLTKHTGILKTLTFTDMQLAPAQWTKLANHAPQLAALEMLQVTNCGGVQDNGGVLGTIALKAPALTTLVVNALFNNKTPATKLRNQDIQQMRQAVEAGAAQATAQKTLATLSFRGSTTITDDAQDDLTHLKELLSIEKLDLTETFCTDAVIKALGAVYENSSMWQPSSRTGAVASGSTPAKQGQQQDNQQKQFGTGNQKECSIQ